MNNLAWLPETAYLPAGTAVDSAPYHMGDATIDFKIIPATDVGVLVIENTLQRPGGPARHLHHAQEEWFYVLQGDFLIEVGTQRQQLTVGDALLAPREVPHAWAFTGGGTGRLLIAFLPAGQMPAFFQEVSKANAMPAPDPDLWRAYGMELVGPPLLSP